MNKNLKRNIKNVKFMFPALALMVLAACASKPDGYALLPEGSDIAMQMDQTEAALKTAEADNLHVLAPYSYGKAKDAFREAQEDRADNQSYKEILEDVSLAQAYLRLAQKTSEVSAPALAGVLDARSAALDAEAPRVLPRKFKDLDKDLSNMALQIEKRGNLKDARDDGAKLAKNYQELRTEALEKGGRPREQRDLQKEVTDLRAQNAQATQNLESTTAAARSLQAQLGSRQEAEAKLNVLREKFSPAEADVLVNRDNQVVIRLKGLKFPSAKADIPSASLPLLSKLEQAIAEYPSSKVTVEGHTDSVGSKEINQSLSKKRAEAVTGYLVQSGSDASREIEAIGRGLEEPVASNKSADGRAQNRRIDVILSTPAPQQKGSL